MPFISIKGPGPEKPPLPTLDFSRVRRAANGPSWHRLPLATISDDARCILGYDDNITFSVSPSYSLHFCGGGQEKMLLQFPPKALMRELGGIGSTAQVYFPEGREVETGEYS